MALTGYACYFLGTKSYSKSDADQLNPKQARAEPGVQVSQSCRSGFASGVAVLAWLMESGLTGSGTEPAETGPELNAARSTELGWTELASGSLLLPEPGLPADRQWP